MAVEKGEDLRTLICYNINSLNVKTRALPFNVKTDCWPDLCWEDLKEDTIILAKGDIFEEYNDSAMEFFIKHNFSVKKLNMLIITKLQIWNYIAVELLHCSMIFVFHILGIKFVFTHKGTIFAADLHFTYTGLFYFFSNLSSKYIAETASGDQPSVAISSANS